MNEETWKPVVGYEDHYSVSSLGRVQRDVGGQGARAGHILSAAIGNKGYACVVLWRDGTRYFVKVHRLVMAAFVGPRPPGMQINHKNGIKHDNRAENLEYVTPSQNMIHAYRIGLRPSAILTEPDVRAIKAALAQGERQCNLARYYRVTRTTINDIARRRRWRHVA